MPLSMLMDISFIYLGLGLPSVLALLVAVVSLCFIGYTLYIIIKRKDECEKWLLTRSMAQGFAFFLIAHFLNTAAMMIFGPPAVQHFWDSLSRRIEISPIAQYLIVLGAFLFYNKRRHGG